MPIEGLKKLFSVPIIKKSEKISLNSQKLKKKKPKKNDHKEKADKTGPETSEPTRKHIDIKI